jgi:hypothetical protein
VEEPETIRFGLWPSKFDDKNMTGRFEHNGQKYTLIVYPAKSGQAAYDVQVKVSEAGKAPPVAGRRSAPTSSVTAEGFTAPPPRTLPPPQKPIAEQLEEYRKRRTYTSADIEHR